MARGWPGLSDKKARASLNPVAEGVGAKGTGLAAAWWVLDSTALPRPEWT